MCGAAIAIAPPFKRSAQFQFVYVTLECKGWLAHELRFSTVANRPFDSLTVVSAIFQ